MLQAGDKIAIIILNADMLHRVTKKFLRRCYTIWEGRLLKKKNNTEIDAAFQLKCRNLIYVFH